MASCPPRSTGICLENSEGSYGFGPYRLDVRRRRLSRDGDALNLTPTVIDVLLYLVRNPGRIVTKDELLDAVWPGRVVEEANVKQAVFILRKALGDSGEFIATAPGRGYRFTAPVYSEPKPPVPLAIPAPAITRWPRVTRYAVLIAVGVVAVAAGTAIDWGARAPAAPGRAVVIADFDNRTGDPVFDHTLTNLLRVDLSQSPFLNVVSEKQAQQTLKLMTKPADVAVTPSLAEEICTRNNGDAVVQGEIAQIGTRYLATLIATDCSGLQTIATAKTEVVTREGVAPAIDDLIVQVRAKLGESRGSIAKFNVPLVNEQTASLDALKAYSEAKWLYDHGNIADAIPLDRHAIELDPNFSAAYANLGVIYVALYDDRQSFENFAKAYALRRLVNEREKLRITALYEQFNTRNYDEAIRNYQVWTEIYPHDAIGWSNLANAEDYIGRHEQAVVDAQHAVELKPQLENPYVVLARAELASGNLASALASAQQAVSLKLAGDPTHRELLRIAYARNDAAGVAREIAWGAATSSALRTQEVSGEIALSQGRARDGEAIFQRISQALDARKTYDYMRPAAARLLDEVGLPDRATAMLPPTDRTTQTDPDYLYSLAAVGDASRAGQLLAAWLRASPADTLANAVYGPEVRAALALRKDDAAGAIAALGPTLPYVSRAPDIAYLWGEALLKAHDGSRAAGAFRTILAHRGWSPESPLYPLAKLGLARALWLTHDAAHSADAYRAFLATWRNADANSPLLAQARLELSRMEGADHRDLSQNRLY